MTATTTTKSLSKAEEIALLEKLQNGKGYFTDGIQASDVEVMITNIKNDFPITLGTSWCRTADRLDESEAKNTKLLNQMIVDERMINDLKGENLTLKEKLNNILTAMIKGCMQDSPIEFLYQFFTIEQIVKAKLLHDVKLDPDEAEWVLENLK